MNLFCYLPVGVNLFFHLIAAYVLELLIGAFFSGIISFPFQVKILRLNGIVAEAMGGLMGVMICIMIPQIGLYLGEQNSTPKLKRLLRI